MKRLLLKTSVFLLLCSSFLALNTELYGQSNPVPFELGSGAYEFTAWNSTSTAGTYPPNMIFHFVPANQVAPFYMDGTSDYNCAYNKTSRPRINGLEGDGINFITTSTSQYNDCSSSGTAANRFIGVALVSLDAAARTNIRLQWKSETITPGDGNGIPANPREWKIRLQYRVGITGLFADVPGPIEFVSTTATGDSLTLGPVSLPVECVNQPVVQVRWIYYESAAGNGGTRPKLRLDDIEISSDTWVGIDEHQADNERIFELFPNPATSQFTIRTKSAKQGTIRIIDLIGKEVFQANFIHALTTINCESFPAGVYFVQLLDESKTLLKTRKLVIR